MKRIKALAIRNIKETVREPLALIFCVAFPLVMLILMRVIFGGMDEVATQMFEINNLATGIITFSYSFTMLFIALNIASDNNGEFMARLFISPLRPIEYFLSYLLAYIPLCFAQTVLFYLVSMCFGLTVSFGLIVSIIYLIPSMLFYIACGILFGTLAKSDKEAGPMCSIIISGSGILGGVWMPIETIGGGFFTVCKSLPFYPGNLMAKSAVKGIYSDIFPSVLIVIGYTVLIVLCSVLVYKRKLKR